MRTIEAVKLTVGQQYANASQFHLTQSMIFIFILIYFNLFLKAPIIPLFYKM